jgi:hypothetical protein
MSNKTRIAGWLGAAGAGLAMAVSGLLTRPAAFLLELLPRRYSHYLLGGELVGLHARVLGLYAGLALALVCASVMGYTHLRRRPGFTFLKTRSGKFLSVILVVLALLTLWLSVNRVLWDDEVEHIHASWYVLNGQVPYRDFFEHHHPLLWFLLAPLLALCGQGLAALALTRLAIGLMVVGIAWLTWRIARLAGGSGEAAGLAVAILFSNFMFLPSVIEIRPDIPMVLLALAAVERLLVFMKAGGQGQLLAAAFSAALAFLFLQKVIFLFPVAAVLLCAWVFSNRVPAALFRKTVAVFLLPLGLFSAWLVVSGAWRDYFLCNWLLNVNRQRAYYLWLLVGLMALVNIVFWLSLLPALLRALRSGKGSAAMKVVAWFGLTGLAALLLLPGPADRHFLLVLPLLSVPVGAWAAGDRADFPLRGRLRKAYLVGLLAFPLPFLAMHGFPLNGAQLEKFAYVLRLSAPADKVLDGRNSFNLFRPDLHYFWFQIDAGEMLDNYRRIEGGPRGDYDPCRLIREQKPRFVLLTGREWRACGVWRNYLPTPFDGLFRREAEK